MKRFVFVLNSILALALLLSACDLVGGTATAVPTPLPPPQHVENAFQWLQTHAMLQSNVDWQALRRSSADTIAKAKTTTDTIPVICEALRRLQDGNTWLLVPGMEIPAFNTGYFTLYPENRVVTYLYPRGPAENSGLRVGDIILERNGTAPKPYNAKELAPPCNIEPVDSSVLETLKVKRGGQTLEIKIQKTKQVMGDDPYNQPAGQQLGSGKQAVGYLELAFETGSHNQYAADVQKVIRKLDQSPV